MNHRDLITNVANLRIARIIKEKNSRNLAIRGIRDLYPTQLNQSQFFAYSR